MKVIDLLNKIANGEDLPKKIKYNGVIYTNDGYKGDNGYVNKSGSTYKWFAREMDCDEYGDLNDEIEIVAEDGKDIPVIPDSELYSFNNPRFYFEGKLKKEEKLDYNFKVLQEKINQVVEVINNEYNKQ